MYGRIVRYTWIRDFYRGTLNCSQTNARLQVWHARMFSICIKPITLKIPVQNSSCWRWKSTEPGYLLRVVGEQLGWACREIFSLFLPLILVCSRRCRAFQVLNVYSGIGLWRLPCLFSIVSDVVRGSCISSASECCDRCSLISFFLCSVGWESLVLCTIFRGLLTCIPICKLITRCYHYFNGSLCTWRRRWLWNDVPSALDSEQRWNLGCTGIKVVWRERRTLDKRRTRETLKEERKKVEICIEEQTNGINGKEKPSQVERRGSKFRETENVFLKQTSAGHFSFIKIQPVN